MKERPKHKFLPWLLTALCFLTGALIYFGIPSCTFFAYIFFGIGAVLLCYRLIAVSARRFPKAAGFLRRTLSICLCLGLLAAGVTGVLVYRGSLGDADADCAYIVVLGAGVNGTVPSLTLRERINAAYEYLTAHPDAVCIVSGGQGRNEDISEAACMFRELTAMGIDPERVWLEDKSTSTQENLRFSLAVIEEKTGARPSHIGIVSSEYHLYRAGLMAADLGLGSSGIPAKTSWLGLWLNYHLREIAAVWAYLVFG